MSNVCVCRRHPDQKIHIHREGTYDGIALSETEALIVRRELADQLIPTEPDEQDYDITFGRRGIETIRDALVHVDTALARGMQIRMDMILGLWPERKKDG